MNGYHVAVAERRDAEDLISDVRPEDRDEWVAAGAVSTKAALAASLDGFAKVARLGDRTGPVMCIWGAVPTDDPMLGTGWLIGTRTGQSHARQLHRILQREFGEVTARFPRLQCWADNRNTTHHVWIRWLGFKPVSEGPFGPFGLPFTYYLKG